MKRTYWVEYWRSGARKPTRVENVVSDGFLPHDRDAEKIRALEALTSTISKLDHGQVGAMLQKMSTVIEIVATEPALPKACQYLILDDDTFIRLPLDIIVTFDPYRAEILRHNMQQEAGR